MHWREMDQTVLPANARVPQGERTFHRVGIPGTPGGSFDLVVKAGRIAGFERHCREPAQWMLLPPLADLHVHANRAFTLGSELPTSLEHAIRMAREVFATMTGREYDAQATRFFRQAFSKGTTRIRTHADIDPGMLLAAVEGTLSARERIRDLLDVEVVAFASSAADPTDVRVRAQLREACHLGAELLGAVPAYYADPRKSIDALLELAIELDRAVDVHLDEHLDAGRSMSEYLAEATLARGLQGRVTLSHGCAISALHRDARQRVAERLALAGIMVIVLPTTNLYLQGRGSDLPGPRGLTAVRELAAAGVALRFASDNVRDAFFPYGGADLLDIAQLAAIAAQIDDPGLLVRGVCGGVASLDVGAVASFVLVPGASLGAILAERPTQRVIMRRGAVLAASPQCAP